MAVAGMSTEGYHPGAVAYPRLLRSPSDSPPRSSRPQYTMQGGGSRLMANAQGLGTSTSGPHSPSSYTSDDDMPYADEVIVHPTAMGQRSPRRSPTRGGRRISADGQRRLMQRQAHLHGDIQLCYFKDLSKTD